MSSPWRRFPEWHAGPRNSAEWALADLPFLGSRFEHLRLTEYRTLPLPRREGPAEAQRLAQLGIASALILAFHIENRPAGIVVIVRSVVRGPWDVNVQLLLSSSAPAWPVAWSGCR